ncbi:MAG TPA: cytochrome c biogenesis protein CcdA [Cyclobacteriaceae bacterium]|nr:cytochrome c biogenesis protein CcdA [Cyclobacteriaceae bacterium]
MPKTVRFLLNLTFLILLAFPSFAQIISPPRWDIQFSENKVKVGDEVELVFKAQIPINWYIYSNDFDPDLGPLLTELVLEDSTGVERVGNLKPIEPKTKFEEIWEGDVTYFEKEGEFRQSFTVTSESVQVAGHLFYQMCSDITGQCINYEEDFTVQLTAHSNPASSEVPAQVLDEKSVVKVDSTETSVAASQEDDVKLADETDRKEAVSTKQEAAVDDLSSIEDKEKASMIGFMILAFLGGLAALLTPCVFPMIPMTVTFFTGRAKSRAKGIRNALVYGFSIIAIYTLAGTLVAATQGPEFANWLSTHWLPNVFFFLVFIFFALAFLGLFEITLPAGLVNKVDAKGDKGGLTGIFFMAFTLVLVSFSCTGPIVGSILIASAGGEIIQPILGMFAFSLAFAIPFALFAIFPEWLNSLPKSGGWLNSVKVVLGFLELALAFKFLSIADQVYHWGLLDRDIYLAIWIVIFGLLGLYLLGKIKLPHDSPLESIGVPRLMLAITTFVFVVYMIPGLWGAPLKALSGYLPPMSGHDFNLVKMIRENQGGGTVSSLEEIPKYGDFLHLPHGLQGYFDYQQALEVAKKVDKPLFIDFTGHGCVNCREMEARVWIEPEVLNRFQEDFVMVALYIDERYELPESEWYTSEYDGKVKKTIGKQNADFQITRFNNNAQPYYVILNHDEEVLVPPIAYETNVSRFVDFLDRGKAEFEKRK